MKTFHSLVMVMVLLLVSGFSQKKSDQLNQKQKDQIKKEITLVFDSVMARFENMDIEGAMKYYSSDLLAFGSGGEKYTLQMVKEQYIKLYTSAASYKWTTFSLDFIIITKDIVVISVDGKNETVWKSGGKLIFDPSHYTFAFKNVDGQWKLSYHHFSGSLVKK